SGRTNTGPGGEPPGPAPARVDSGLADSKLRPPSADGDRHLVELALVPVTARVRPNLHRNGVQDGTGHLGGAGDDRAAEFQLLAGGAGVAVDVMPRAIGQARAAMKDHVPAEAEEFTIDDAARQ